MKIAIAFYQKANLLSLDVAAGAVISSMFFATILKASIPPVGLACLGLSVWIIYTADHLLDAYTLKGEASTDRHRFHQENFKPLFIVLCLAIFLDGFLTIYIRTRLFQWGMALSGCVFVYFLIQSTLRVLKEPAGALLYTLGVLLPALSVSENPISVFSAIIILQFVITALINLILFSWFDFANDRKDSRISMITAVGARSGKNVLIGLFLFQGIIAIVEVFLFSISFVILVPLMMNVALMLIFIFNSWFSIKDRFRYAGDAVFFLPLICFLS